MNSGKGKKKKKLPEKEMVKFQKYKAAQVGLDRKGINFRGEVAAHKKNDLFQILKEEGIECISPNEVDTVLIKHATKWIKNTWKWIKKVGRDDGSDLHRSGVLVVASADSDFLPLIKIAQDHGLVAVSANPNATGQTRALVNGSDIVLVRGEDNQGNDCLIAKSSSASGADLLSALKSTYFPMGLDNGEHMDSEDVLHEEAHQSFPF